MPHDAAAAPELRIAFAGGRIERASDKRHDDAWRAARAADAASRAYVLAGDLVILRKTEAGPDPLFALSEAESLGPAQERALLGVEDGAGRFAVSLDRGAGDALKGRGFLAVDLRSIAVQGLVLAAHMAALATAKALLGWHARHRFCSACGGATALAAGGWRRDCPACGAQHFPRTDPVVIMLAAAGDRCVLARQKAFPPGMWSCLAGFVEPGENIEEAARRETQEEVGLACGRVRYLGSQPWPFPMSLMIGCEVEALSAALAIDRSELEDARWFPRAETVAMLAGRHPDGLTTPPPWAIAHQIIRAWAGDDDGRG